MYSWELHFLFIYGSKPSLGMALCRVWAEQCKIHLGIHSETQLLYEIYDPLEHTEQNPVFLPIYVNCTQESNRNLRVIPFAPLILFLIFINI